jgi:hypothetical protein
MRELIVNERTSWPMARACVVHTIQVLTDMAEGILLV